MRRLLLALAGLGHAACLVSNPRFEPTDSATTAGATTGATSATPTSAVATSDASVGASTATSGRAPDLGVTRYPYYPVTSCAALQALLEGPMELSETGYYTLDDAGASGETVDVYCDMELSGGGWTLVGRSAGDAQLSGFGWRSARGDVAADDEPYSLDLRAHPIPFTEILVGARGEGKAWGDYAYVIDVGPDYVDTNLDAVRVLGAPMSVLSPCDPWPSWMFQHGGFTGFDQVFYFRDFAEFVDDYYGLRADGFYLYDYLNCEMAGFLNGKQGMIMVR